MKFSSYAVFIILWVTIVYAPVAHWVWGGGWLGELGALDFAGGNVVHINSGVAALTAAIIFGKRLGFGSEPMEPHNVPMVVMGAGLLWFGWFGFNAGSALSADGNAVNAFVATNTAAAAGILGWTATAWLLDGKPSVIGAASGAVAGLVAITPAAGFVGPLPAIVIGLVAGVVCDLSVRALVKLNLDDALSVWGVHGMGGTWGALATGLFVGVGFGGIAAFTDASRAEAGSQPGHIHRRHVGVGIRDDGHHIMDNKGNHGPEGLRQRGSRRTGHNRTWRDRVQVVAPRAILPMKRISQEGFI